MRLPTRTVLIAICVGVLAVVLIVLVWIRVFPSQHSPSILPAKEFPGSLLIYLPQNWTAPDGEVLRGLVYYTPSTGAVSYAINPASDVSPVTTPSAIASDGSAILAINMVKGSFQLTEYSLKSQSSLETIASSSKGPAIAAAISPDGNYATYLQGSSPYLYLYDHGKTSTSAPAMLAVGFNPYIGDLLLATYPSPTIRRLSGATTTVSGIKNIPLQPKQPFPQYLLSSDGNYLAVILPKGPAALYKMNWNEAAANTIGSAAGNGIFGSKDSFLTQSSTTLTVYAVTGSSTKETASYGIALPPTAQMMFWNE